MRKRPQDIPHSGLSGPPLIFPSFPILPDGPGIWHHLPTENKNRRGKYYPSEVIFIFCPATCPSVKVFLCLPVSTRGNCGSCHCTRDGAETQSEDLPSSWEELLDVLPYLLPKCLGVQPCSRMFPALSLRGMFPARKLTLAK